MPMAEGQNIINRNEFTEHIRRLRIAKGLLQTDLCNATGICPSTLSRIESGRSLPSLEVAARLAVALGITLDRLVDAGRVG